MLAHIGFLGFVGFIGFIGIGMFPLILTVLDRDFCTPDCNPYEELLV